MKQLLLTTIAVASLALGCTQTVTLPSPSSSGSSSGSATFSSSSTSSAASSTGSSSGGVATTSGSSVSTSGGISGLAAGAPCKTNDSCDSKVCGANGSGHCCNLSCASTVTPCGASDCDDKGACVFPGDTVACGADAGTCMENLEMGAGFCDGKGNCSSTRDCSPFLCSGGACLAKCADVTECIPGDFCDTATSACCAPFVSDGNTLSVDSALGKDQAPCCGIGGNPPCLTLTRAMQLIDSSQTPLVTIFAAVDGGEGDWLPPSGETYPIVLGWGVELIAPAVYFFDPSPVANAAIFDIAPYPGDDPTEYASIASLPGAATGIGMNQAGTLQTIDPVSIAIAGGKTLYLANVAINGSASRETTAIDIAPNGSLFLGSDHTATVTGGVEIGNALGATATDGWRGIECETKGGKGCMIEDLPLTGQSALIIQGQEAEDLGAGDGAQITLTSEPIIGVPPTQPGFGSCPSKNDLSVSHGSAVTLNGSAQLDFENGTVQCVAGAGFTLNASSTGVPELTVAGTTIQNTDGAVLANAGSATLTGCMLEFNYLGAVQGTTLLSDGGITNASLNLSGAGDAGANTIVCCSDAESSILATTSGVCVLNTTGNGLDADGDEWDTSSPDLFSCTDATLMTCTCKAMSCTVSPGTDGMDAVYDAAGSITTSGNTLSSISCQSMVGPVCKPACMGGEQCCQTTPISVPMCHAPPCPG